MHSAARAAACSGTSFTTTAPRHSCYAGKSTSAPFTTTSLCTRQEAITQLYVALLGTSCLHGRLSWYVTREIFDRCSQRKSTVPPPVAAMQLLSGFGRVEFGNLLVRMLVSAITCSGTKCCRSKQPERLESSMQRGRTRPWHDRDINGATTVAE